MTATIFGHRLLPAVPDGAVPFWRIVLRGCAQCCFQTNEVTGALFLLAVLAYSGRQALFMLIGAVIGPLTARLVRADGTLIELGLFGFNSCLMALALGNFMAPTPALWLAVALLAAVTALLAALFARFFPLPMIAAPFILTFWAFLPIADHFGLTVLQFPPFADEPVRYLAATLSAMGATLFAGTVLSGTLFFAGLLVSNWRHALLAVTGAIDTHVLAVWWNVPGEAINAGLAGLNAVLASVGIYVLCGNDLRLALLGSIAAGLVLRMFSIEFGLIPLAAGFVLVTWAILILKPVQDRWFTQPGGTPE